MAVLFRAYAQKVLRQLLVGALEKSDVFPLVKRYAEDFIQTNDPVLLAYDRAFRDQVDQSGNMDRAKLEAKLKEQMAPVSVPDDFKDSLVKMLESGGFFDTMANMIKQNGELFGAYRAVGQGGLADRVMQALAGSVEVVANDTDDETAAALSRASSAHRPVVACTGGSRFYKLLAAGESLSEDIKAWYVNSHCYTVLGFDAGAQAVTLRNPWGLHPDPEGVLRLPLDDFMPAFRGILTTKP